jgi:dimethylglycine catabolism A
MTQNDDNTILFRPLKINGVKVKNRLAMGPIAAHSPLPGGRPSNQTVAFFAARAIGGIGLIIVGGTVSTTHGWEGHNPNPNVLRLDIDEFLPDLRCVTAAAQRTAPLSSCDEQIAPATGPKGSMRRVSRSARAKHGTTRVV